MFVQKGLCLSLSFCRGERFAGKPLQIQEINGHGKKNGEDTGNPKVRQDHPNDETMAHTHTHTHHSGTFQSVLWLVSKLKVRKPRAISPKSSP